MMTNTNAVRNGQLEHESGVRNLHPSVRFVLMSVPGSDDGIVPTYWFAYDWKFYISHPCTSRAHAVAVVRALNAGGRS